MYRRSRVISVAWIVLLVGLVAGVHASAAPLQISVSTHKPAYVQGEPLFVGVTAQNPNPYDVVLHFPTSRQAWYTMDGFYDNRGAALQVLTSHVVPALGSSTWNMSHNWSAYNLSVGSHSVVGTVVGVGSSPPALFDVITPTLPTSDVFIDFTNLPDGSILSTGFASHAYAAWGVHFGIIKDGFVDDIAVHNNLDNQYLDGNTATYPPGFNILAEFDMPVYGVSAEVSSAAGRTVTMVAKDIHGVIIDSVTSDPVPNVAQLIGPLALHSSTPIASVEWWPSSQNSGVMIDNLYLTIPAPGSLALLALGSLAMLYRRKEAA